MDTILEVNAPFYGEVLTLAEPLAYYRIHDNNDSQQNSIEVHRVAQTLEAFEDRLTYFTERCLRWRIAFDPQAARECCLWYAEYRLAAAKVPADAKVTWTASLRSTPRSMARW